MIWIVIAVNLVTAVPAAEPVEFPKTEAFAALWERRAGSGHKGGVLSLSCVPVGLTAHREGLPPVDEVTPDYARDWIRRWEREVRRISRENQGEPWLLLADEWYTRAGVEVPGRGFYSPSWAQLENGVGLVRRFLEQHKRFLRGTKKDAYKGRKILLLTGSSFAPTLERCAAQINRATGSQLRVAAVRNFAFGQSVTVAGLLCGKDLLYAAHADREARGGKPDWVDAVVVPSASLRTHTGPTDQYTLRGAVAKAEGTFLDDLTLEQLSAELGVPVVPSGENLSQTLDHLRIAEERRHYGGEILKTFHREGLNLPQGAYNP